jgi:hypothetical protein
MKNYCYRIFILERYLDNYIIGIISRDSINLREIMCSYAAKIFKNSNNLFKQLFLMHLTYFYAKFVSWNVRIEVSIE